MQAPVVILMGPQMGENIGAVARVMSNFGLEELRIVNPRDGWPNLKANAMAANGEYIIQNAQIYKELKAAIEDLQYLFAAAAFHRELEKPVMGPKQAMLKCDEIVRNNAKVGIMLGREQSGLTNEEMVMADAILTISASPKNPSLNLAQAMCVIGYEYYLSAAKSTASGAASGLATKAELESLFKHLEEKLDDSKFFYVEEKKHRLYRNIKNAIIRSSLTSQEVRTFHGIIKALTKNSKGQ